MGSGPTYSTDTGGAFPRWVFNTTRKLTTTIKTTYGVMLNGNLMGVSKRWIFATTYTAINHRAILNGTMSNEKWCGTIHLDHRCTIPEVDNDQTSKFNADRDFDAGVTHRSANEVNQNNENAKVNKKNISCTEVNDVGTQLARQGWWRQDPHPQNEQESRLQFGEAHRFTRDDRLLSDSPLENATEGREPYFGAT